MSRRASLLLVAAVGLAATALPLSPSAGDPSPLAGPGAHRFVAGVEGRTIVVEPPPTTPPRGLRVTSSAPRLVQSAADTFALSSNPGASRTIFLDVDGHDMTGSQWDVEGWPDGVYPAFDLDGDPGSFSTAERAVIQQVWARVAEDFAPFDVNVTTAAPPESDLTRTSSGDTRFGVRALVVGTARGDLNDYIQNSDACGGCVGVAYLDTFDRQLAREHPALTVAGPLISALGDSEPALAWQLAETISHEVGHTFSLRHDRGPADKGGEYYEGTEPWSPIMGGGVYGLTQWSKGEYAGYTSAQTNADDLALIAQRAPYRTDDHGNGPGSARALASTATASHTGIIHRADDQDAFVLTRSCTGPATISAVPAALGPNLDIELRRVSASGSVLATSNPPASDSNAWPPVTQGLGASLNLPDVRGTHYFVVRGGGQGAPANGGWSSYGSVGAYTIQVTTCADGPGDTPPPAPRPPLAPTGLTVAPGAKGKPVTVVVRWRASTTRGTPVTAYALTARKHVKKRVTKTVTLVVPASARSLNWKVGKGRWSVRVQARSAVGASPATAWSRQVAAR